MTLAIAAKLAVARRTLTFLHLPLTLLAFMKSMCSFSWISRAYTTRMLVRLSDRTLPALSAPFSALSSLAVSKPSVISISILVANAIRGMQPREIRAMGHM